MKKIIGLLLAVVMVVSLLPAFSLVSEASDKIVKYKDSDGKENICSSYIEVTSAMEDFDGGWYVVDKDVTLSKQIGVFGDTNLILCEGATLTIDVVDRALDSSISVDTNKTLNIYAGSVGEGSVNNGGKLEMISSAIAFSMMESTNLNIYGGDISAISKRNPGFKVYGQINIAGGVVYAKGGSNSREGYDGIHFMGGGITVIGGEPKIYAIGGDIENSSAGDGIDGSVTVTSGSPVIEATGGASSSEPGKAITGAVSVPSNLKVLKRTDGNDWEEANPEEYRNNGISERYARIGVDIPVSTTTITTVNPTINPAIKTYQLNVEQAKARAVKLTKVKAKKHKKALLKWKKSIGANGYEIAYSTNKKFKKKTKIITIKKIKTVRKTVKKLKVKKKYFFKIRTFNIIKNPMTSENEKIYGVWSKVKKIKVKK